MTDANDAASNEAAADNAVVIDRTFEAPVETIWKMWTDSEHFARWYGPTGFTVPVADMDVTVGGRRHVCMASPDGSMKMWTVGEFTEVTPTTRLAYTEAMSDEDGNVKSAADMGMPDGHPDHTEVTVVLEAAGEGKTRMVMTHAGVPADSPGASGWAMAFDKLDAALAA